MYVCKHRRHTDYCLMNAYFTHTWFNYLLRETWFFLGNANQMRFILARLFGISFVSSQLLKFSIKQLPCNLETTLHCKQTFQRACLWDCSYMAIVHQLNRCMVVNVYSMKAWTYFSFVFLFRGRCSWFGACLYSLLTCARFLV